MLARLQANGWWLQLHAGPLGHALMTQTPNCPYFNGCRLPNETPAAYQARVQSDLDQGIAKLQQYNFISGNSVTYALPFDFYGQGTADTAVTNWFPGACKNLCTLSHFLSICLSVSLSVCLYHSLSLSSPSLSLRGGF